MSVQETAVEIKTPELTSPLSLVDGEAVIDLVALEEVEASVEEVDVKPVSIDEAMMASIGRTMLVTNTVRIPLISKPALEAGNERVRKKYGSDARELVIAGPDAVIFDRQKPILLGSKRTAEFLGFVLLERSITARKRYFELGFFKEAGTVASRNTAFSIATLDLASAIRDTSGKPLLTRDGIKRWATLGIDDVVVSDVRHTTIYQQARQQASLEIFTDFILNGGGRPSMAEKGSILAARSVMRSLAGDKLSFEQTARFASLSEQAAALTRHHTDEVRSRQIEDESANERKYFRAQIADLFAPRWQAKAACEDRLRDGLFYPEGYELKDQRLEREAAAKKICAQCVVREDCLRTALENHENDGVWGGLNPKERKQLVKYFQ